MNMHVTPLLKIQGGLPARVTSPGNYTYAYIDNMGVTVSSCRSTSTNGARGLGEQQIDELGKPIPNFAYKIATASGEIDRGFTDSRGEAIQIYTGSNIEDMLFEADTNEDHVDK